MGRIYALDARIPSDKIRVDSPGRRTRTSVFGATLGSVRRESIARLVERSSPDVVETGRVERAPVDRHRHRRAGFGKDLGCGAGAKVPGPRWGPHGPHRKQRDVGGRHEIGHPGKRTGVAGEIHASAVFQLVAERLAPWRAR